MLIVTVLSWCIACQTLTADDITSGIGNGIVKDPSTVHWEPILDSS